MDGKMKTVSWFAFNFVYERLIRGGISSDYIEQSTGISRHHFNDCGTRISPKSYSSLFKLADKNNCEIFYEPLWDVDFCQDDILLNPFFCLCLNSESVLDAIENYLQYREVIGSSDYILFNENVPACKGGV